LSALFIIGRVSALHRSGWGGRALFCNSFAKDRGLFGWLSCRIVRRNLSESAALPRGMEEKVAPRLPLAQSDFPFLEIAPLRDVFHPAPCRVTTSRLSGFIRTDRRFQRTPIGGVPEFDRWSALVVACRRWWLAPYKNFHHAIKRHRRIRTRGLINAATLRP